MGKFISYFSLLRVSHWSKSIFVLLGFFYTPIPGYFYSAVLAAFSFSFISSAVYIYNDIQDLSEDSLHPHKSKRALASDQLTVVEALGMLLLMLTLGMLLSSFVSRQLVIILACYLLVNLLYNHLFKLIPILDVSCITIGFMLRVLAGTIGIGVEISTWLFIAASLLSLFIALNKRRLEMQLGLKNSTRKVLKKYNPKWLHASIALTGMACFITYLFYTLIARSESFFFILTLPFAAIALTRFAWLATQNIENDDPITVFLSDRLSRINLGCFSILTFMALT